MYCVNEGKLGQRFDFQHYVSDGIGISGSFTTFNLLLVIPFPKASRQVISYVKHFKKIEVNKYKLEVNHHHL